MKLRRYKIYAILSLFLVLILSFIFYFERKITREISINNKTITVEVANTFSKRTKGLMFRESLPENEGMLFVFDKEDNYSFWMLNVKIPLDMIWIDENKKITHIENNVQPCENECPKLIGRGVYVLEVNANYTAKNGVKVDDEVSF